MLLDNKLYEAY